MSPLSLAPRPGGERPANRLLADLPQVDFEHLQSCLQTVSLAPKQVLHKQGEALKYVYFPNGGVVSMMTLLPDGGMVEAATIGDDGFVGIEAFFEDHVASACETIVQVPVRHDSAERMSVSDFRRQLLVSPVFAHRVARSVETLYAVLTRLTACNTCHDISERCARWLLMTHDRMHRQDFSLSHEFLAVMLGVRRQSVSVVAAGLKRAGLIDYVHGRVTVLDRPGLEAAACDCYSAIRGLTDSAFV